MTSPHDQNIARGIALLDEKAPGWERRVDLKTLDLNSCTSCVVGQLFAGQAEDALQSGYAALNVRHPRRYGFALDWDLHHAATYGGLTTAWKRVIRARLTGLAVLAGKGDR